MTASRPNILWYCTDQQRFDTIASLGTPHVQTPTIDGLVNEGVAFTHAYCQSPICTPSRASFMTGQYPSRVHNTRNGNDTFPAEAPPLITRMIADAGYECGLIGKFHLVSAGMRPEPRLDDGFTDWWHSHDPHPPFIPPKSYADRFKAEDMPGPYFRESDLAHQAKLASVDFQGDVKTPEEHDAHDAQAKYYAMIAQIDDQFARILQTLEETGQRDNTVIIFTSDHGETLGDHGLMWKGCRFYEGLVRVPLIFSWPGQFQQNVQANGLVELLDMSATILDLCGVEIPDYFQGRSLLPVLRGEQSGEHVRDFVRCEYFEALDPFFTDGVGSHATMYRNDRFKLSLYHDQKLGELFDLQNDPWEFDDLWDHPDYQDVRNELVLESFHSHAVMTTDVGTRRIAPM